MDKPGPSRPPFSALTVARLSGPIVVPVDTLKDLHFLSQAKSVAEYERLFEGPYLVGHIVDREAFTAPLVSPWLVCTTLDGIDGYKSEPRVSHLWTPGSEREFPDPRHRRLITDLLRIDAEIGFAQNAFDLSYDQRSAMPGQAQRGPAWHRDGNAVRKGAPLSSLPRTYIVASTHGTLFLPDRDTCDWKGRPDDICDIEARASANGTLIEAEPYAVYMMAPEKTWHRGQTMSEGGPRTFLRLACG